MTQVPDDAPDDLRLAAGVVAAAGDMLEPEQVADVVVEGLRAERFLILPHPEVLTFFQRKADDYDRWLAGMRRLQARLAAPADAGTRRTRRRNFERGRPLTPP